MPFNSEVQEVAGAEAPDAAAASSFSSPTPEASSSSPAPIAPSSPGAADEARSSPKLVVVEADRASQMSGSGCTSQASVDDDDDVPITDIYFVSKNPNTHTNKHIFILEDKSIHNMYSMKFCVFLVLTLMNKWYDALLQRR